MVWVNRHTFNFFGVLETRVKINKMDIIATNKFGGWKMEHNYDFCDGGRI